MSFSVYRTCRALALGVVACVVMAGCRALERLFQEEEPFDPASMVKYWDGPRIGCGMNLNIQVGSATLKPESMNVLVDQNGDVTLPYPIDTPIACDGLTLDVFKEKLVRAYSSFIRQPQVTVTFGAYDGRSGVSPWGTVMVMGEVGTPGPVNMPTTKDMTVTKAIQIAGGAKQFANKNAVKVWRCDKDGNREMSVVDLQEIGEDGRFDKDMALKAGDVVYVPETWY